jgi:hypothetical protein
MRTLEDIQQALIAALARENSNVNDLSPGSVLNTLIRSIAVTMLEQENKLEELRKNLNPQTATGGYLDDYASAVLNLSRKAGSIARGQVIATTDSGVDIPVPTGTVLTDLTTANQFITLEPATVSSAFDAVIEVSALTEGEANNLPAGTPLYDLNTPLVSFVVGAERDLTGEYCGNLTNGSDYESDFDFRARIDDIKDGQGPTLSSTLSAYLPLERFWINTRAPGFIHIYLDTPSELTGAFENELRNLIKDYLSPGTYATFEKVSMRPVPIGLDVIPVKGVTTDEQLTELLQSYFGSLQPGATLLPESIGAIVRPFVRAVSVTRPTRLVQLRPNELASVSDLQICYNQSLA